MKYLNIKDIKVIKKVCDGGREKVLKSNRKLRQRIMKTVKKKEGQGRKGKGKKEF